MKNKLVDLNNHLFEQMERLNDDSLTAGRLSDELERTKGMVAVAAQIIANARLMFDVQRTLAKDSGDRRMPALLSEGVD